MSGIYRMWNQISVAYFTFGLQALVIQFVCSMNTSKTYRMHRAIEKGKSKQHWFSVALLKKEKKKEKKKPSCISVNKIIIQGTHPASNGNFKYRISIDHCTDLQRLVIGTPFIRLCSSEQLELNSCCLTGPLQPK